MDVKEKLHALEEKARKYAEAQYKTDDVDRNATITVEWDALLEARQEALDAGFRAEDCIDAELRGFDRAEG
jgi:hypothetical protein